MWSHRTKPTAWVYIIYCESMQSALHSAIMVQIAHFHSKLHTPKWLVLLGGSTYYDIATLESDDMKPSAFIS